MGFHKEKEVRDILVTIGVDPVIAAQVGREAAQLTGPEAKAYVDKHGAKGTRLIHLTNDQQVALQSLYLPTYEAYIKDQVAILLLQREFDALVSFTANAISSIRPITRLPNQKLVSAALESMLHRLPPETSTIRKGMMTRRRREVQWFITGRYTV